MKDLLGCAGWAAAILFASALIPFFGSLFSLLTPLPFLYYSTKLGFKEGVKIAALSLMGIGLIAGLLGFPQIIIAGIELALVGIALSALFKMRLGVGQTVFFATVLLLLLSFGYLVVLSLSRDMGPIEIIRDYLHTQLKTSLEVYEEMGMTPENAIEFEAYARAFIDNVFLSVAIIGVGFVVWLNVVIAKPLFKMANLKYPEYGPMDRWQAPEKMIWGVIASGFALFLLSGVIKSLAINVLIVLMVIYLFHGLSIILFFLNKYRLPPWIRASVFFLIIIQQFFWVFLGLAGLFDQWIDFRKLRKEPVA